MLIHSSNIVQIWCFRKFLLCCKQILSSICFEILQVAVTKHNVTSPSVTNLSSAVKLPSSLKGRDAVPSLGKKKTALVGFHLLCLSVCIYMYEYCRNTARDSSGIKSLFTIQMAKTYACLLGSKSCYVQQAIFLGN